MNTNETKEGTNRRNFLGTIATGAAAIGLTSIAPSSQHLLVKQNLIPKCMVILKKYLKRSMVNIRIVFDSPHPHEIYPICLAKSFFAY